MRGNRVENVGIVAAAGAGGRSTHHGGWARLGRGQGRGGGGRRLPAQINKGLQATTMSLFTLAKCATRRRAGGALRFGAKPDAAASDVDGPRPPPALAATCRGAVVERKRRRPSGRNPGSRVELAATTAALVLIVLAPPLPSRPSTSSRPRPRRHSGSLTWPRAAWRCPRPARSDRQIDARLPFNNAATILCESRPG